MRVLHVTPYFAPAFVYGGPPRSILGLCKALRKAGISAEVFTTTANGNIDLEPSGVQGSRYESVPVHYFRRTFPKQFFQSSALTAALSKVVREYDLVHLHGLWNFTVWAAANQARKRGVPYITSTRGMLDAGSMAHKPWRKKLAYEILERNNLNEAALLHATSDAEADVLKSYGLGEKAFVLSNGVDVPDESVLSPVQFRKQLQVGENTKLIVFLGRIHPIKRLDLLAEAFAQVRKTLPTAQLIIAGPNENNYRQQLEPYFAPIQESVHWLGEVGHEEKFSLLRAADALVMCSDSESFGVSVVEGMAAGLPVVVTHTCPWEEIETARCGYWVAHARQPIADALIRVLTNPSEAKAMGERGKSLVEARYRWDTIASKMVDYYTHAIKMARYEIKAEVNTVDSRQNI